VDPLALGTLAGRYTSSSYAVLIEAAIVVALLSATVGILNGLVRVIFALARDGLLPRQLAVVSPRRRTPDAATLAASCVSVVIVLGLGLSVGPFPEAVSYLAAVATLPVLVLYGSASVSLFRYVRRHHADDFRAVPHVLVPVLGLLIIGLAVYGAYHPFPQGTVLYLNILLLGYVAVGVVLARRWARRHSRSVPQFVAGLDTSPEAFDEVDADA
jgi:amino acid transporter